MDKETLSHYGWIVILTLILACLLAFATPFAGFIKVAIMNTVEGLVDATNKIVDSWSWNDDGDDSDEMPPDMCGHNDTIILEHGIEPTCTASGMTDKIFCNTCQSVIQKAETINPLGHDFGEPVIDIAPTCATAGTETTTCQREGCGETSTTPIPAKGHTEVVNDAVAQTCTTTGLTAGKYCGVCGEILIAQEVIPALGHNVIIDDAVEATCVSAGKTEGSHCSRCEEVLVKQEVVAALGHDLSDAVTTVYSTCVSAGEEKRECRRTGCDYYELKTIDANGHNEVIDAAVAPKCEETGLTEGKHCDVCDTTLVAQVEVPATGHTEVTDPAIEPTCTETGLTEGKHCSVCGKVLEAPEVVDALGHNIVTDPAVEPDCENTGLTEGSHCDRCGQVIDEQEVVPATGHTDEDNDKYCDDCNKNLCEHTQTSTITIEATCTEGGATNIVCDTCGEIIESVATTDPLGHYWVVDPSVEPTCTETGLTQGIHCSRCGEVSVAQEIIPANGHTDADDDGYCDVCEDAIIPEGGIYYVGVGATDVGDYSTATRVYIAGEPFPETPANGDVFVYGDYEYRYRYVLNDSCDAFILQQQGPFGWCVSVRDRTKDSYGQMVSYICSQPVICLSNTFRNCTNLEDASNINLPSTIETMSNTFRDCSKLTATPEIPDGVTNLYHAFQNTKITVAPTLPSQAGYIQGMFQGCTALTDISKLGAIPSSVWDMANLFYGCTSLGDVTGLVINAENAEFMSCAFYNCTSLTGTITINATCQYNYGSMFGKTTQEIWLTTDDYDTYYDWLVNFASTDNNDNVNVLCYHDKTSTVSTAATCTETGLTTIICDRCGNTVQEETVAALGHNYTSTITTEPTCSSTGIRTFTCTRCSDTFAEEIPAVTHIDADIDFICDNCGAEPVVPVGGEYYSCGTTYNSGEIMPSTPQTGDQFMLGDYVYMYNQYWSSGTKTDETMSGWSVKVINPTKTTYSEMLPDIYGTPIVSLVETFAQCENMIISPSIPSTVTNLTETYYLCSSLTTAPAIPSDIKYLSRTFVGCTSLNDISNFVIPEGATVLFGVFSGCESLETAPLIPSTVTDIFSIFSKCKSLKTYVGSTDPDGDFSGYIIPYGVTDVSHAFSDCDAMVTAPKIPNSVTVAQFTFRYCDSLTGVVYFNSVREVGAQQTFDDTINDIILVTEYPDATAPSYDTPYGSILSAYQQNDGNVKFGFIFDIVYSGDNSCYITVNETTYTENTRLFIPIGETVTITCNGNNGDCLGSITHNGSTKTTSTLSYSFTSYGNTTITINSSTQDGTPYGTITIDTPVLFDDQISYN